MRKLFCCILGILCAYYAFPQLENSNWVLGDSIGIKFNADEEVLFNSSILSVESSASISSAEGNLLFYSDGITVWNKEQDIMENGDSLFFNENSYTENTSSTQGVIILNKPNSDSLFYVFSLAPFNWDPGLVYAVVDIKKNENLGEVVEKNNTLIADSLTEKLSAVKHANGRDWWLIGHYLGSNIFYTFLIDPTGIHGPFNQPIGSSHSEMWGNIFGQIKLDQNGNKLLSVSLNIIDLFDFDRCNGVLSNWEDLSGKVPYEKSWLAYSCEFSPNGQIIYVVITKEDELFQLNIDGKNLEDENFFIVHQDNSSNYRISQIALALNGKIYVAKGYSGFGDFIQNSINKLSVINYPNFLNESCEFLDSTFETGDNLVYAGLPNLANYSLGPLEGSECDTLNTAITEQPNPASPFSIYPNPASNVLNIETVAQGNNTVIISQVNGSICYTGSFTGTLQIPVAHFAAGVYSISIMDTETGVWYTEKWVKML